MDDFVEKINTIELLALHEEALAQLYSTYAEKFPECDVWSYLYGEETKHSGWVRSILDNVEEGSIDFQDMHLSQRTIEISLRTLERHQKQAEDRQINLEGALDKAFKLENSIIENKYLDYFSSLNDGVQKVLDDLKSDTKDHREMLRKKREEYIIKKRNERV